MSRTDSITYVEERKTIDYNTGEIITEETTKKLKKSVEPAYVKLYLDCLLTFKDLSKSLNPVLVELLKNMSYASNSSTGGQIIYINAALKRDIAESIGVSVGRIEQAITSFVKSNILYRLDTGKYQVNAHLFGLGEWKNISNIRAMFDFRTGTISTQIETNDGEMVTDGEANTST